MFRVIHGDCQEIIAQVINDRTVVESDTKEEDATDKDCKELGEKVKA